MILFHVFGVLTYSFVMLTVLFSSEFCGLSLYFSVAMYIGWIGTVGC